MSYIDLRDLEGEELELWKQAIENQTGYNFELLADCEPVMIPENEFADYAEELATDIGVIGIDYQWPLCCIDWEMAADGLKCDYTSVEVDETEYWFRAS